VVIGYSLPGVDAASTEFLKHFGDGGRIHTSERCCGQEAN
jgi:hypothetical protein